MGLRRVARAYMEEIDLEVQRYMRLPSFLVPVLLFPSMFYALFVCLLTPAHDSANDLFWLADYASFAAIAPGLFAFGMSAATERENGFLLLKRALPVPRFAYFGAKLAACMVITALSVSMLMLVACVAGRLLPSAGGSLKLILVDMFGAWPFSALGLLIGSFANARSATCLVNLLLIPLAFFSGLLVPVPLLPHALRAAAAFSPGYDLLALSLASIEPGRHASPLQAIFPLLFAIVLGALAQWRLRARR
jgi:ABC-2 type transport system permease protein